MQQFNPGDRIWFINKFKRRCTGTYLHVETVLWGAGTKDVHIVVSSDAMPGIDNLHCIVPDGKLHKEKV